MFDRAKTIPNHLVDADTSIWGPMRLVSLPLNIPTATRLLELLDERGRVGQIRTRDSRRDPARCATRDRNQRKRITFRRVLGMLEAKCAAGDAYCTSAAW